MTYLRRLDKDGDRTGCFFCRYRDEPARDADNNVLARGQHAFAMLNEYPYNGGHCLVAPYDHIGEMTDLPTETLTEMMVLLTDLQRAIRQSMRPDGFNVGANLGRSAGAGLPGHLHMHLVPRWSGDTNFMPVLGNVHVLPDFLGSMRRTILQAGRELSLPALLPPED
jgi:ATP adenylyltransferase